MKPLVVHIRACNFFGGPERQIVGHIKTSKEFRHLVITFADGGEPNDLYHHCKGNDIHVVSIPPQQLSVPSSVKALRSIFSKEKPAVICCHGYKPLILSLLAKVGRGIPLIAFARGHTGENFKIRIYEYLEYKAQRYAEVIVAVSKGYADLLIKKGRDASQIEVIRNAIDVTRFKSFIEDRDQTREELGFSPDEVLIATAGRLSPEKAQKDLIMAFSRLEKKFPYVRLLLCGDGPLYDFLQNLVSSKGISNISFLGFRKDLDKVMAAVDLFVLPSLTEGLPNVLLEAVACRVPLVATNVGGVPEIITNKKTGLMVEPGNVDQLASAIEHCLRDKKIRRDLADNAYKMLRENYHTEGQTRQLESLYTRLIPSVKRDLS